MPLLFSHLFNRKIYVKLFKLTLCISFTMATSSLSAGDVAHSESKVKFDHFTKIICIGDSITQGGTLGRPEYSYRLPLYYLALENDFFIEFIGTRQHGLNQAFNWPTHFDRDHEGYYGKNSAYIRNEIIKNLKIIETPDIAIIHIGTNDKDSVSMQRIVKPTKDIIKALREKNPKVKVLIIQIPGKRKYFYTHLWIWLVAMLNSTYKSPIKTIDLYSNWDANLYTFDGAHPNIDGQNFMAERIFTKLQRI
ncbi:MAG: hypothetical protein B7Y48_08790 [Methylophilales bacterium 28-44-11]|nr:MAG: hypothetical protein B7Y48_08790 [Methylophilales bacterium 28-44-11]